MPKFECSECGEKFSSREKRRIHEKKQHGDEEEASSDSSISVFGSKKLGAGLIIIFMIGLPLGGGMFYSSLSPSSDGSTGYNYTGNPPVGNGGIPAEGEIPESTVLDEQIPDHQQVFLMAKGGSIDVGRGFKPAVLLQYSCKDCRETVDGLVSVANSFNQNERLVYVAPYRDMESRIAVSGLRNVTKMEEFEEKRIKDEICGRVGQISVQCAFD